MTMRWIPDLDLASLRAGYHARAQAPFDALGHKLGLDVRVLQMTRAQQVVAEPDLHTMLPVLVRQLYTALASEEAYGFCHVVQPGCRIYTCLAVRDGERVVASVQPSARGNPLPNPGWSLPRWNPDEPARNVKAALAWARDPARANDAGAFPIVAPLRRTDERAPDDVRSEIAALARAIDAHAPRDPRRATLLAHIDELVLDHRALIVGELARIVDTSTTRDGFVDGVAIRTSVAAARMAPAGAFDPFEGIATRASRLATGIDAIARETPRRVSILVDRERAWSEVVASGVLGRVRDLEITGWQTHPMKRFEVDLGRLVHAHLEATERLAITWVAWPAKQGHADDVWTDLLPSLRAPALRALRIAHADLGPRGLALLASPRLFPGLVEIELGDPRRHGEVDIDASLRAIGMRPGLRALSLASLPADHAATIAHILEHAELTSFAIQNGATGDEILGPLASALSRRPFDRVVIEGAAVTPAGIAQLIRSPGFAELAHFTLRVPWDLAPLDDALLATTGRTLVEVRDARQLAARVRDHVQVVRPRVDGTLVRDE